MLFCYTCGEAYLQATCKLCLNIKRTVSLDEVDKVSETLFFLKWRIFFLAIGMWDRYGKAFNNIWAASAFKGNYKQTLLKWKHIDKFLVISLTGEDTRMCCVELRSLMHVHVYQIWFREILILFFNSNGNCLLQENPDDVFICFVSCVSSQGATDPWSNFVPVGFHVQNNLNWLDIIDKLPDSLKMTGIALTGWSR